MKKAFLLTITLLFTTLFSYGAYLKDYQVVLTQPDGSTINCLATGDEFYNFLHTKEGYVIKQAEDGYYYFAEKINQEIKSTQYRVSKYNPNDLKLEKWIMPDESVIREKVAEHYRQRDIEMSKKGLQIPTTQIAKSGEVNNLVIFITFYDQEEYSDKISNYDNMFNNDEDVSLKTFYKAASYEKLDVTTYFCPEAKDNVISIMFYEERGYFLPYNATSNPIGYKSEDESRKREKELLDYTIEVANEEFTANVNFDSDKDGNIDNIVFMIKGGAIPGNSILWPHRYWYFGNKSFKGKKVYDYNVMLSDLAKSTFYGVGTLCHEFFHTIGSPDLYHYSYDNFEPTGKWDLMETTANPPQFMCNFLKYQYTNWISSVPEITKDGEYSLSPATSSTNNIYKLKSESYSPEFFILEYRKKEGPFDSSIPGSGLLVYRVNTNYWKVGNASGPPDEIYLFRPNGAVSVNGNINNANLSKETGRTSISDITNPRMFFSDGSNIGIEIYDISECGETISFKIGYTIRTQIVSPANNSIEQPIKPTISWRKVSSAKSYQLQLASDDGFQNIITNTTLSDSIFTITENLDFSSSYFVRVRWSNATKTSNWSDVVSFSTVPTNPEMLFPVNNSSEITILPTLIWTSVPNNNIYQIFIAEDSEFNNIYFKKNFITDTIFKITKPLELNKTYYCKVKSTTASGYSSESNTSIFTTKSNDVVIISQSESSEVCKDDPVSISVSSAGSIGKFEWYLNDNIIEEAKDSILNINSFQVENEGEYYCKVISLDESFVALSKIIKINLINPPDIIEVPGQVKVDLGDDFNLVVEIDTTETDIKQNYKFQWMKDSVPITDGSKYSGTKSLSLSISKADVDDTKSSYSLRIITKCGDTVYTNSSNVVLSVYDNIIFNSNSVSISPNPAIDAFNISIPNKNGDAEILLYDLNGILVADLWKGFISVENSDLFISLKDLNINSAIYIIAIKINNEILTSKISIIK